MKKFICLIPFLVLAFAANANAQASAGKKLSWDIVATSLTEAQGYTYKFYPDGSTTGQVMTSTVCTGTASPFSCSNNFPAFTPGQHTLTITATNAAGESAKSLVFTFTFVVVPSTPTNIRVTDAALNVALDTNVKLAS